VQLLEERIDKLILLPHHFEEVLAFTRCTSEFPTLNNTFVLAGSAALAHILARREVAFHLETLAIRARSRRPISIEPRYVRVNALSCYVLIDVLVIISIRNVTFAF